MKKYNCIIVEDEPLAAEVLQDYVSQVPFLELKGVCTNAMNAMDMLQKEKIDLVFLDIHLPKLKGLDFLKTVRNPPHVIVTTAYQEYALQGYELSILDYLLKPIEFNRFLMAVNKLAKQPVSGNPVTTMPERPYLYFNVRKKQVKIFEDDILYVESLREYVKITTKDKTILTKIQLGEIEEMLTRNNFLRIHRSFIVSKNKIDAYSATGIEINGKEIPIGRNYKEFVLANL
jgi:DNA-binding LytR/AlgR family response regulator